MRNKLIKHGNSIYRILDSKDNLICAIDCIKCTMPKWISEAEFENSIECTEQELLEATNITLPDIETLDIPTQKQINERFNIIAEILPFVSEYKMRTEKINDVSAAHNLSKQTVRNYLCLYLTYQNRKVEYIHDKPGIKTKNWAEIDDKTLPDVQKAIKELLNYEPPKRVTVYAVEQMLKLPSKHIERLPKCKNEILKHYESQEKFWARKVSWAVEKITEEEQPLNWKHIRDLTNMRKQNLISCIPYLNSELIEKIELML